MSAISITPANVTVDTSIPPILETANAGVAITAGQCVYKDTSDLWQLSDANGAAALRTVTGVAINNAAAGQPLTVAKSGTLINIGATVVAGTVYVSGATAAGDINPSADLTTGWYTTIIGVATTTGKIWLNIFASGAVT